MGIEVSLERFVLCHVKELPEIPRERHAFVGG
jgi:hypothetical protein